MFAIQDTKIDQRVPAAGRPRARFHHFRQTKATKQDSAQQAKRIRKNEEGKLKSNILR